MARFTERRTATTTVKVADGLAPVVYISTTALNKMQVYVEECADEIGWLGTVEKEGNVHYITDVYLFEQEVHSTTTEITPEGLAQFGEAILARPDGMDIWNNLKMWGHSHVNMPVSPSGQDDSQMVKFKDGGHDWFIRLIANKKGDMKLDLYNYEHGITYTDMRWAEYMDGDLRDLQSQIKALEDQLVAQQQLKLGVIKEPIKAEMKDKVRKKTSTWTRTSTVDNPYSPNEYANEYGYYCNKKWSLWSKEDKERMEAEKKTLTQVKDSGQKTSGKSGETVSSGTNKSTDKNSFFIDDDDVCTGQWGLDWNELMSIAYCETFDDVENELIAIYGTSVEFTQEDIERVYRVALKRHPYAMKD